MIYKALINNITLIVALSILYSLIIRRCESGSVAHRVISGLLFGAVAVVGMMNPFVFSPGLIFDGRSVIISIGGFIGGWATALIASLMAIAYRVWLGGVGAVMGVSVITSSAAIGIAYHYLRRRRPDTVKPLHLLGFGIVVHICMLILTGTLPSGMTIDVLSQIALPVILVYPLGTLLISLVILEQESRIGAEKALKEREIRYRELVENANSIILRLDNRGAVTFFNEYAEQFLGYPRNEILGRSAIGTIVPARDSEGNDLSKKLQDICAHPELFASTENENIRQDGSRVWIHWTNKAVLDERGHITEILCIGNDITERKRSEDALRLQTQRVQALLQLNQMTDASLNEVMDFTLQAAVKITESAIGYLASLDENESVLTMHSWSQKGLAEEAITDKPILFTVEKLGLLGEAVRQRRPVMTNDYAVNPLKKGYPEGHVHIERHLNVPIFRDRRIVLLVGVGNKSTNYDEADIQHLTLLMDGMWRHIERQKADTALRESEERFKDLAELLPQCVYEADKTGRITYANRQAFRTFGYFREDLDRGITVVQMVVPGDRERAADAVNRLMGGGPWGNKLEYLGLRKDGTSFPVAIYSSPIVEQGQAVGIRGIILDMTESKQAEENRRQLEERLQRSEKMEALGTLAGGVAHDLNNVLGVLVGYSELLLTQTPEGSPMKQYAQIIFQGGERAAAIIQDLLALARRAVTISQILNLNRIVSDFMNTPECTKIKMDHPNVVLKTETAADLLNIKGSPVHLTKALMNLVTNAMEAVTGTGEVIIRTENRYVDKTIGGYDNTRVGEYTILSVSDNGSGISTENLGRIFEPFYTRKVMGRSGTGLGLSVVWGTVKDHQGYIDVQSADNLGTIFTLYFPVTREPLSESPISVPVSEYLGKGESILIVDDVADQRELATQMLERLNYRAFAVAGGKEALEFLKTSRPDLIILDMIMEPGMDGLETYQRILEIAPRQKAVIVSGFAETERVKKTQELGAGAYVRKPYILERIGLAIRKELDRR